MRVGITGHQRLDDSSAWQWVADMIGSELDAAAPPLVAVTSLAIGADQLLARLTLERGGAVHAVLPFQDIEHTFEEQDQPAYRALLAQAMAEVLDTPGTKEDAYFAAGKRVVELADLMLAVWNGLPAKGRGGTADVVRYALERGVPLVHINPVDRTVTRR